ncbi:hypothetical protein [Moorena bouillonii]|uniref:Uncharacterized protein n=1 Tax=Moorena bouillonii PNG TaxID=568701 RepID=A0A1U7N2A3_9CYAN|nr:hypothetical protein [Moorena bouillonii]OLT60085.1 hypothetical protein BJP37_14680 [Moorena bouillonii PNG]
MAILLNDEDRELKAAQDLNIRHQILTGEQVIKVPPNYDREFWGWYASFITFGKEHSFEVDNTLPSLEYPKPHKPVALWYSGWVESTYTLHKIEHLKPDLLSIDDYPVFSGPHRRVGQVHFLCAAVAAQLGYEKIYIGMERNDLFVCRNAVSHSFIERDPLFAQHWNKYCSGNEVISVCSHLHKEELIEYLHKNSIPFDGSCDNSNKGWCRDCFKCFEAFYSAKVNNIDLGFKLTRSVFRNLYEQEYMTYVHSRFKENPYNALQYFMRLQISYGLDFSMEDDCELE